MNQYVFENFSQKFLALKPLVKFLLVSVCGNISFHMSAYPLLGFLSDSIGFIGAISLVLWLHGIAYKSVELLKKQGVETGMAKYIEAWMFAYLIVQIYVIAGDVSQGALYLDMGINITISYIEPVIVSVIWFLSYILMSVYTAKLYEFSVLDEEPEIDLYYKTLLMTIFPFVGIWLMEQKMAHQKRMFEAPEELQNETLETKTEETSQSTFKKYVYECREGELLIQQKHDIPTAGDKAFLNGNPAPTQKFEIGENKFVYISNGIVYAERM